MILDGYIGNREIWLCPSAKLEGGANFIVNAAWPGGWMAYLRDNAGLWPTASGAAPCWISFPSGWGGEVTDSIAQDRMGARVSGGASAARGCFLQSIAINTKPLLEKSTSRFEDPSWTMAFADGGNRVEMTDPHGTAFPDMCFVACLGCFGSGYYGTTYGMIGADWANCPWSQECGANVSMQGPDMVANLVKRAARHLGGSNLGFLDGHAAWMAARAILAESPRYLRGGGGLASWFNHDPGPLVPRKLKEISLWWTNGGGMTAAGDPAAGIPEGYNPCPANLPYPLY